MSSSDWIIRNFSRKLRAEFVDRCDQEGRTSAEVLEAWLRRAIRQERTIMPEALEKNHTAFDRKTGTVVQMRKR